MTFYSYYRFKRDEQRHSTYILVDQQGADIQQLKLGVFADNDVNRERGVALKRYMIFTVPRSETMKKYFAYTFESSPNEQFTSVEALNEYNRTFGDAKKIGLPDLVLFEFSDDREKLEMYFIAGHGNSLTDKRRMFQAWNYGVELEPGFEWTTYVEPEEDIKKREQQLCLFEM